MVRGQPTRECGDNWTWGSVDGKSEHVRAVVVADRVEHPARRQHLCEIQFRDQDCFLVPGGAGEYFSVGADDDGVARFHPLRIVGVDPPHSLAVWEVLRDLVDAGDRVHTHDVAAAFACDVPHRCDPTVASGQGRRQPDV